MQKISVFEAYCMSTVEKFYSHYLVLSQEMCDSGKCRVDGGRPLQDLLLTAILHDRLLPIPLFLFPICSIPLPIHLFPFAPVASLAHMVKDERAHKFHFKPLILPASFIVDDLVSHEDPWRSGPPILLHLGVFILHAKLLRLKNEEKQQEK